MDFLYEASDEDARKILISAVQATTSDARSCNMHSPDLDIGSDESENGDLVYETEEISSQLMQEFLVEYNRKLQPVPEEICRHSDFKQVFQDASYSAELVDAKF